MTTIPVSPATYTATATQQLPKQPAISTTPTTPAPSTTSDTVSFSPRALELMERRSVTDQERATFNDILNKAAATKAHDNPKQFLNSLSTSEMEVLRKAHTLADPINIDTIDFEGAYNLLRAPGDAKDLNDDGGLAVGIGVGWVFPPPNAPEAVHSAWEEATAGLSEEEVMIKMGPFLFANRFANSSIDENGHLTEVREGEPGYRNIFSEKGFSYQSLVKDLLENWEASKAYNSADEYEKQTRFLNTFLEELEQHSVS